MYEQNAISASSSLNPYIIYTCKTNVPTYYKTNDRIGYVMGVEKEKGMAGRVGFEPTS